MNIEVRVSDEVACALAAGRPVVALESTIISHGFPYPANVECARTAEAVAREGGAVPATVAVIDGVLRAGLSDDEIEMLGTARYIPKASRRDLPVLVARGATGATTVAGTMAVAALAGIRVFATGGIGGVHRGGESTWDVSADLVELATTPVLVVCAGAKSILDIGRTLEYLETHGVPVLGYRTDAFPAFYTRESGFGVDARVESPAEVADVARARFALGAGGLLVANPIPPEHALDPALIDAAIAQALAEADERGVHGKDVTPYVLGRIHEITGGASERANKELVYSNGRRAAAIAAALGEQEAR
jgi:pseudouridine-5'-phosphate glycosidase